MSDDLVERLKAFCADPWDGENRRGSRPAEDDQPVQSGAYGHELTFGDLREIIRRLEPPSRESSDELAALAAKYLGMDTDAMKEVAYLTLFADIKRLAGSVVSQARGDK